MSERKSFEVGAFSALYNQLMQEQSCNFRVRQVVALEPTSLKILPDAQYQECNNLSLSCTPFLCDLNSMQQLFSQLVSPVG